jgi:alpha-glucosidase
MLSLYRRALDLRRTTLTALPEELTWGESSDDVLVFRRGPRFTCVQNFSTVPVPLPRHERILLASGPLHDEVLPPDTCVWLS